MPVTQFVLNQRAPDLRKLDALLAVLAANTARFRAQTQALQTRVILNRNRSRGRGSVASRMKALLREEEQAQQVRVQARVQVQQTREEAKAVAAMMTGARSAVAAAAAAVVVVAVAKGAGAAAKAAGAAAKAAAEAGLLGLPQRLQVNVLAMLGTTGLMQAAAACTRVRALLARPTLMQTLYCAKQDRFETRDGEQQLQLCGGRRLVLTSTYRVRNVIT